MVIQHHLETLTNSIRDKGRLARLTGTLLLALGISFLSLIVVAYFHGHWQEWLDIQQRQVTETAPVEWPLLPLSPAVPPVPSLPKQTTTPAPLAIMATSIGLTRTPQSPVQGTTTVTPTPAVALPVRIIIPKINVNSRIVEITPSADGGWATAAFAIGRYTGTALLGQPGNMIFSCHNNTEGEVFKRLSELQVGDKIQVYSTDREYRYVVVNTAIIQWAGASDTDRRRHLQYLLPATEATLTLISCWPYWIYTHRVYVVAKPVP